MTEMLAYGVRYRESGNTEDTVEPLPDEAQVLEMLQSLYMHHGIVGQVVTRPAIDWTPDRKLNSTFARQVAEDVIGDLSEGEIDDAKAVELLRPLGSVLLDDAQVVARKAAGLPFTVECTFSGWLERAVNLREECGLVSDGLAKDLSGVVGADYDNHIAVLAGLAEHAPNGCLKCGVVGTAKTAEVAA